MWKPKVPARRCIMPDGRSKKIPRTHQRLSPSQKCTPVMPPAPLATAASRFMAAWVSPGKTMFTFITDAPKALKLPSATPPFIASASRKCHRLRRGSRRHHLRESSANSNEEFSMSDLVQLTKENGIAVITINNPPVNALSPGVPRAFPTPSIKLRKMPPSKPSSSSAAAAPSSPARISRNSAK